MKILFLADIVPYPPNTGLKIRTYNVLRQLHRHGHEIFLLCFNHRVFISDEKTKEEYRRELAKLCAEAHVFEIPSEGSPFAHYACLGRNLLQRVPYRVARYDSRACAERIRAIAGAHRIDLVHLDKTELHGYARLLPGVPAVPTNHNVESLLFARRAQHEVSWLRGLYSRVQAAKTRRYERDTLNAVPGHIAATDVDAETFRRELGVTTPCAVIENGVDIERYQPLGGEPEPYVLIIGAQSREATGNYDATMWFLDEMWPQARRLAPDLRLKIVGRNPDPSVQAWDGRDGVEVIGFAPDERPYLGKARALLVPLRVGGGSRLKILTAFAMGTCVLATTIGAEGIACTDGVDVKIEDEPEGFARALARLWGDEAERRRLGEGGRRLAERRYDWDLIGDKLDAFYRAVVAGRAPAPGAPA